MRRRSGPLTLLALTAIAVPLAFGAAPPPGKTLPFTVAKDTTVITFPLLLDGSPDYLGALNEKYGNGVTPQNNGFILFLQAAGTEAGYPDSRTRQRMLDICGAPPDKPDAQFWVRLDDFLRGQKPPATDGTTLLKQAMTAPWSASEHPQLTAYLKEQKPQLDLMVEASKRPRWWCPCVARPRGMVMTAGIPSYATANEMARSLCARSMLRLNGGDFEGFTSDIFSAKRLARQIGGGAMMTERVMAIILDWQASETLGAAAGRGNLSAAQCRAIGTALSALPPMPPLVEAVDLGERWQTLDAITRLSRSKANQIVGGNDALGIGAMSTIEQQMVDYDVVLRLANTQYDQMLAAMRDPTWAQAKAKTEAADKEVDEWTDQRKKKNSGMLWMDTGEPKGAYSERVGKAIIALLLPNETNVGTILARARMEDLMLQELLAAAQWKAQNGSWPKTLDELSRQSGTKTPTDEFAPGQTLRYMTTKQGARVYSVGPNGNGEGGVTDRQKDKDDFGLGVPEQ